MAQESPDVEILVHVTAPSLGADDVKYRKQAQAYLDFQPETEINIDGIEIEDEETDSNEIQQDEETNSNNIQQDEETNLNNIQQTSTNIHNGSFHSSKSQFTPPDSLDLSFEGVLDNRSSPPLKTEVTGDTQTRENIVIPSSQNGPSRSQQPFGSLPSEIGDSYPLPNPASTFISPTRALQQCMGISPASSPVKGQTNSQQDEVIRIESSDGPLAVTVDESSLSLLPVSIPMAMPSTEQRPLKDGAVSIALLPQETGKEGEINNQPNFMDPDITHISNTESGTTHIPSTVTDGAVPIDPIPQETGNEGEINDPNIFPGPDITHISSPELSITHIPSTERDETVSINPIPQETANEGKVKDLNIFPGPDITHISNTELSIAHLPSPVRAASEPPQPKRLKTITDRNFLARSASDTSTPNPYSLYQLPTEIWSPEPPVGVDDLNPTAMVPDKLQKLATDLSSRYKPEAVRELNPLERGYWLLDCRDWTHETRQGTWTFLIRYVEAGMAGWGVWCHRDVHIDWIRLYCWGHIAKHAYLLLYLASGRMLKYTGAVWKDGEGETILRVTPHEKHEQQNQT